MAKGSDEQAVIITALSFTRPGRLTRRTWADGFLVTSPLQRHVLSSSLLTPDFLQTFPSHLLRDDPFEATSRMAGSQSAGPSSGRRRSLRRLAATYRRLIDEEEEEIEGEASSPGEEERVAPGPVPVRPIPQPIWALLPFELLTSHR
ncbi:UNVERIFIED_CONTAM: hypothetical protein Slati_0024200 [Sesamum latifolium]|uniref:Uncharacterized protein n=1 Tax=Sesamum latifolium TaxID=2727402 RepID=A0AAW2Y6B5_9LAMI